ncbi:MAG: NAD(+) diphosphatase [Promethearchaeota archaeon]
MTETFYGFFFLENKLLVNTNDSMVQVPLFLNESIANLDQNKIIEIKNHIEYSILFGTIGEIQCFAGVLNTMEIFEDSILGDNFCFMGLWELAHKIDKGLWKISSIAFELIDWYQKSMYCGRCGSKTVLSGVEYGKKCPSCAYLDFPRLSPSIIVAVRKKNKILLAHNAKFPEGLYSIIAGFVNPGESLEEAVKREVMEETSINVKNICYVNSEPWPFPNSLMMGFNAEYASGTIIPDGREITSASWFGADEMPVLPPKISIARRLIDRFIEDIRNGNI